MRVRFHTRAVKSLEKIDEKEKERIRLKLKALLTSIESQGIIPFKELDVKRLEGEWKECFRMRAGRIRIVFRIDREKDVLFVYAIDYRGGVYK